MDHLAVQDIHLEDRLARLEKRNRLHLALVVVALAAALVATALNLRKQHRIASVDEFVLRDASGSVRAALKMTKLGPALALFDEKGHVRAALTGTSAGATLAMDGAEGGVLLSVDHGGPSLGLLGKSNRSVSLNVSPAGANLSMFDQTGVQRFGVGTPDDGPKLQMFDTKDRPRVTLMMSEDYPVLGLSDGINPLIWLEAGEKDMPSGGRIIVGAPNESAQAVLGVVSGQASLWLQDQAGYQAQLGNGAVFARKMGQTQLRSAASLVFLNNESDHRVIWAVP